MFFPPHKFNALKPKELKLTIAKMLTLVCSENKSINLFCANYSVLNERRIIPEFR